MSKIEELLKNEEVVWKSLGEVGEIYGGITGKKKGDFENGNSKFITYKNVYSNIAIDTDDKVKINEGEKQRKLEYGDKYLQAHLKHQMNVGIPL